MEGGGKLVKRFTGLRGSLTRATQWTHTCMILYMVGVVMWYKIYIHGQSRSGTEYTGHDHITTWLWA